jgi:hypothetical protein
VPPPGQQQSPTPQWTPPQPASNSGAPSGWAPPAQQPQAKPGPAWTQPQAPAPGQQGFQNLQNQRRPGPEPTGGFANALAQFIMSLDRELEVVAKAGSDAFARKDLQRADAALKFSGKLTEFRNMATELLEYYKRR